jgi:hypothetical protein
LNLFRRIIRDKISQIQDWRDPNREESPTPCAEITIGHIPEDLYGRLLAEASAGGAQFNGAKATISSAEFDWNYDAPSATLHITCTKKPFFISCDSVERQIRALVAASAKGGI